MKNKKNTSASNKQMLLSQEAPFAYKEAYKLLRANLSFVASSIKGCKKIVVSSAMPNEGKSMLSINLAISLSEMGHKVLLIDCDLRNPSVHRYLRIKDRYVQGLSTILSGQTELSECLYLHPTYKFNFIVAGMIPPNPNEILGSTKMELLLEALSESFDYIICDAPPVGMVSDALVLSGMTDGVILSVKHGDTKRRQVKAVKQAFEDVGANILGVVLNQCSVKDMREKYDYKKYGYDYVSGYGKTEQ